MIKTSIIKFQSMKNIPLKRPPITGIFDSDWDGVPNDRDCVWYDPNRQGYKSMKW